MKKGNESELMCLQLKKLTLKTFNWISGILIISKYMWVKINSQNDCICIKITSLVMPFAVRKEKYEKTVDEIWVKVNELTDDNG